MIPIYYPALLPQIQLYFEILLNDRFQGNYFGPQNPNGPMLIKIRVI